MKTEQPVPRHGAKRNWRMERTPHTQEYEGPEGAEITVTTHDERSVVEEYCAHCQTWVRVEGVSGALRFMAHHDSGECANGHTNGRPRGGS